MLKSINQPQFFYKTPFANSLLLIVFLLFMNVFLSCTTEDASNYSYGKNHFPYTLKEVSGKTFRKGSHFVFYDVDCDLRDEFLQLDKHPENRYQILLFDEKVGAVSWVLNNNNELGKPFCANLDQEGNMEIIVPEKVGNSIFLNVYTSERRLLNRFHACKGEDLDTNGVWDGDVFQMTALDLNGDGILEIVAAVRSHHDLQPRGVLAFSWREGKEIWRFKTGTQMYQLFPADIDNDRLPEIICSTSAPSNGSNVNGTSDNHSYIIVLNREGKLLWKKEMDNEFSRVDAYLDDIDLDGGLDIIALQSNIRPETKHRSKLTIINARTRNPIRERLISPRAWTLDVKDINNDGKNEIMLVCNNGQLLIVDSYLNPIMKFENPQYSNHMNLLVDDLNNDGTSEIVLSGNKLNTIVFDNELKNALSVFNDGGAVFSVKTNPGQPKRLAIVAPEYLYFLDLVKAPTQGPSYYVIGIAGSLFLSLLIFIGRRLANSRTRVEPSFFEAMPVGIISIDGKGIINHVNQRAQKMLGLKAKAAKGKSYHEVFHDEVTKNILELLEKSRNESWEGIQEIQMKVGGEPRELLVSISTVKDKNDNDTGKLVMIDDVSDLVMSQRALAWAMVAQQAAHKIKNPLTMMKLAVDRIQSVSQETFGDEAKKLDRYIETNRNQISALLNITDAFMQIADLKPPNFQPTNVNDVIECVLGKYTESFSKDIGLSLNLDKDLPNVRADERQLETVIENLLTNALAAMGEKGSLNVSTSFAQRFQDASAASYVNEFVQVELSDTGRGIPSEDMDKLFDQFFSRREGGTGMGLAIVKKIIDDHQGHIHVESIVGVGTTFTVFIPIWG